MKRVIKSLCMLAFMLFFVVAAFPFTARAEEKNDEKIAININVPADWENPCVWAWNEDGTNAFEAWPGGETEANPDNDGWYYVWVPSWANHIIVNANEGTVQTDEIVLEGETNTWITITAADAYEVSYESLTTGETPAYVEKFVIHAKVDDSWENPCLWAWSAPDGTNAFESWPGIEMKKGDDGWYTAKAPIWVNAIIVNGNDGSVQTEDLSIDPAEIWVTVDADGKADFSYVDPDKAAVPNVTVHVIAPADWENPCLWAWSAPDGTNVFASWPGEALDEVDGWLTKEIPGWVNSVIVNGNDGSVQTADISIDVEKDIWLVITDAENYELYYEEPEVEEAANTETVITTETTSDETAVEETATAETEEIQQNGTTNIALIIVIVVVVIVILAVILVVLKKKRK